MRNKLLVFFTIVLLASINKINCFAQSGFSLTNEEVCFENPHEYYGGYEWNFGDSTELVFSELGCHVFNDEGLFKVTLIAFENCPDAENIRDTSYYYHQVKRSYKENLNILKNPYSDYTQIEIDLEQPMSCNLIVSDINGIPVKILFNGVLSSGIQKFSFSAKQNGFSAGNYNVIWEVDGIGYQYSIIELP